VKFGSLWDVFSRGCFAATLLYHSNLVMNLWQFVEPMARFGILVGSCCGMSAAAPFFLV